MENPTHKISITFEINEKKLPGKSNKSDEELKKFIEEDLAACFFAQSVKVRIQNYQDIYLRGKLLEIHKKISDLLAANGTKF